MANKLDHVAFNVPDVRKAAQDFNDVFGIGSVLVFNDPLGLYIAITDVSLVLSTQIDPENNPSPVAPIWANDLVTAIEVKVPDRDAVHKKMLARGIKDVFEMCAPGGFREYFYDKSNFYGFPVVVTEYPTESLIEAVDADLAESPEDYGTELTWNWAPGYKGWSRKGKDYPDLADNIPSTSDSRVAVCALIANGQLDAMMDDFDKLFDMPMVKVTNDSLGLRIALGDGGYFLWDNIDPSRPSPIASNFGAGVLGALGIRTSDLAGVHERLASKGVKRLFQMKTPGGLTAAYYDKTNFHGLPVMAVSYEGDSVLNAINPGLASNPGKYSVDVSWD